MRRVALVLPLLVLAACGDSYPEDPQEVARQYVSTNDSSKCRFLAQRLIESLTNKKGEAAREACERNVARVPAPKRVTLKEFEVDPKDAEVELVSDGKEAKLQLVRAGEKWQIAGFSE